MESIGITIGEREVWAKKIPFGLLPHDRHRHLYIIGQTGTGKSSLIGELVRQDLDAGEGLALIDPHGDLADQVLEHVPRSRTDDVIVIDTDDRSRPIAINPFYRVPADEQSLVAANLVSTMKHTWSDSWGPRLQYILGNAARTVVAAPDRHRPTILGIARVLVDRRFRNDLLRTIDDARVLSFWRNEFDQWPQRQVAEALSPVQNKLGELFANPFVTNMLCQWKPSFDFYDAMNDGKIIVVRIAKGTLGEEPANLFGSLVASSIQQAAMRRLRDVVTSRRPFHLYIDEFQNFTTDTFASALSETRKVALSLTLAHQYIAQLSDPVREAVFGNVGSIVSFRLSGSDAAEMSRQMLDFNPLIFRDLRRGELCVSLIQDGQATQPFRGRALFPTAFKTGRGANVRQQSRMRYGRKRETVEQNLARWLTSEKHEA
jgi:type IV secretory pathway TraG/TraD family ATPase VirD4